MLLLYKKTQPNNWSGYSDINLPKPITFFQVAWYKYLSIDLYSAMGLHIGHSISNSIRQASWMIYGFKWDISIINLTLTIYALKASFSLAAGCATKARPFWFVTQDKSFSRYSRYLAIKCGEFSSTLHWIRGMGSNFGALTAHYFKSRPKYVYMRKDLLKDLLYSEWFFTRLTWPGGVLVSSIFHSSLITKDVLKGYSGCIGLLDTNANINECSLAIPANDDSIDSVVLLNDIFAELILYKKLWAVLKWYYSLEKEVREENFFERWVSNRTSVLIGRDKQYFSKKFGKYSPYFFPVWFISNFNRAFNPPVDNLELVYGDQAFIDIKRSIRILNSIFQNTLLRFKSRALANNRVFYGKCFYQMKGNLYKGVDDLELGRIFLFRYGLKYGSFRSKKYFTFKRRKNISKITLLGYLTNISFLLSLGIKNLYQKCSLYFINTPKVRFHKTRNYHFVKRFISNWWIYLGGLKKSNPLIFLSTNRNFFPWDPWSENNKELMNENKEEDSKNREGLIKANFNREIFLPKAIYR
jgi:ribosomal protein S2